MELGLGDVIGNVLGPRVGDGWLLDANLFSEQVSANLVVELSQLLAGNIIWMVFQVDEEEFFLSFFSRDAGCSSCPCFDCCCCFQDEASDVIPIPASFQEMAIEGDYEVDVVFPIRVLGIVSADEAVDGAFDASLRVG